MVVPHGGRAARGLLILKAAGVGSERGAKHTKPKMMAAVVKHRLAWKCNGFQLGSRRFSNE
ncbi:hypothetical protein C0Z17_18105 [Trinickia caryophylli]|nr:hypothetical protein C0Z17_18105 [Trinickia caryophylli]